MILYIFYNLCHIHVLNKIILTDKYYKLCVKQMLKNALLNTMCSCVHEFCIYDLAVICHVYHSPALKGHSTT